VALRSRFVEVQFSDFERHELEQVILAKAKASDVALTDDGCRVLTDLFSVLNKHSPSSFTMRETEKILRRQRRFGKMVPIATVAASLLRPRCTEDDLKRLEEAHLSTKEEATELTQNGRLLTAREGAIRREFPVHPDHLAIRTSAFERQLCRALFAADGDKLHRHGEPLLLIGTTSFKTTLVRTWCRLMGREDELVVVRLTPETECGDLIGELRPYSLADRYTFFAQTVVDFVRRLLALHGDEVMYRDLLCREARFFGDTRTSAAPSAPLAEPTLSHRIKEDQDAKTREEREKQEEQKQARAQKVAEEKRAHDLNDWRKDLGHVVRAVTVVLF
jgi:hypothetical protein